MSFSLFEFINGYACCSDDPLFVYFTYSHYTRLFDVVQFNFQLSRITPFVYVVRRFLAILGNF